MLQLGDIDDILLLQIGQDYKKKIIKLQNGLHSLRFSKMSSFKSTLISVYFSLIYLESY
jgi:hypothetical protein